MPIFQDRERLSFVREKINNAIVAIENFKGFRKIKVTGQSDVDALVAQDDLTIVAGSNVSITSDPTGRSITISSSGGTPPRYEHTQSISSNVWTVNHNLGFYPTVHIYSSGRVEVEADYFHTSVNQTVINFNTAQTGIAVFH